MRLIYRIPHFVARSAARLLYHHKVYGVEHIPAGGVLLAANHASFLDPPLVGISCNEEIVYLARETLFDNSVLSFFLTRWNVLPVKVSKEDGEARTSNIDPSTFKKICRSIKEGKKVLIFPEGTRSLDGELQPIKSGVGMIARIAHCPIVPVYIANAYQAWNRHQKYPKLTGNIACVFGSPIYPEEFEHLDKKERDATIALSISDALHKMESWYKSGSQ